MKTTKTKWMMLLTIIATAFAFSACGGDDDKGSGGGGNEGITGYYISGRLYSNNDFKGDAVWELMRYDKEQSEFWGNSAPTYTLFDSNGMFSPVSSEGELFWLRNRIEVIRVDANFFYSYSGVNIYKLGASGTTGMELLYKFDAGEYGILGFYGYNDDIYTYTREGNKLIVDVGDGKNTNTFVITGNGLSLNGGGNYIKYDPNITY